MNFKQAWTIGGNLRKKEREGGRTEERDFYIISGVHDLYSNKPGCVSIPYGVL